MFEGGATTKVLEFTITHKSALECSFPVPAVFSDYAPNPATCLAAGTLRPLDTFPSVSLTFDRGFDGPGSYTLTATALNGYTFSDGTTVKTRVIVVDPQLSGPVACPATTSTPPASTPPASTPPASTPTTSTSSATPAALPATGGVDMTPWGIAAALMMLTGAALLATRRLARR